ncbi:HD-GYP domain-containing protein [Sporosarcina thermotolerans]|uniref:HD-GYP domain-containing protein n=1 Tax=Sporosarcina thermotolerans TaxID=633404 RepID=A0AAW9AA84_9BACL|nr:HD-GYP domain-containing protein [Sporosarcina thermotolerans]MDW0117969.1 HD-GYP domain-containing protein [Sporosarcina thermotolerans]WHT49049.1 HD-GYP domain-containing protein [Sporosarcina thermotolerans]
MEKNPNRTYRQSSDDQYPVLHMASGLITLFGRWNGLAEALFSLNENGSFCAQYNINNSIVETYTLLDGEVEIEHVGERRKMEIGETIDASAFEKVVTFYAITNAEIVMKMEADFYEQLFFETKMLQVEMDTVAQVDGYTYHHCERIRQYAIEVWKRMNRPKHTLRLMRWGAFFHDIGKLAIPLEILHKPGKLTEEEWETMKSHSRIGANIMRAHPVEWLKDAAFIVEQHHEWYDGRGYPYGLKEDEISIEAAIVSVVDAYDAMTTERVYKQAVSKEVAILELEKGKGTQFHPEVVDHFIEVLGAKVTHV